MSSGGRGVPAAFFAPFARFVSTSTYKTKGNSMLAALRTSVLGLFLLLGWAAIAQADDHPYSLGTVWEVTYVQAKPSKFEDYMKFLSTTYTKEMDAAKAKGLVTSY